MVFMAAPATPSATPGNIRRVVAASLVGTTIEWYDNLSDQGYDLLFPKISAVGSSTEPARVEGVPARF
ncbi:hypothetical protein ACFXB3_07755 [Streptomyces sp. NPDC059447]|uniref:hypothetical protein n=1 Tax=Streptomyces sp. NPDC059447 TaxID=3346834 RepID=UPI0036C1AE06